MQDHSPDLPLMNGTHHHHSPAHDVGADGPIAIALLAVILGVYLLGTVRLRRSDAPWSRWRAAGFVAGILLVMGALAPPVMAWGHADLRGHMVQHLLIGMFAPLGLVMGAPVTLALRTLPVGAVRSIAALLRTSAVHWLTHPVTALVLNIGGMYVLYLTPLYRATLASPMLHHLVHVHFLLAGCLFTWAIAGVDPAPRRPRFGVRVGVLIAGIATHAYLAKLMYAHLLPRDVPHTAAGIQSAAQLMYYGGDLAELLLAVMLFAEWYRRAGRRDRSPAGRWVLPDKPLPAASPMG